MTKSEKFKNLFNDAADIKFGCVMFDLYENEKGVNEAQPGSGWASIEGGDTYRIAHINELANNVIWISNLTHDVYWKSGVVKIGKIKYSGYLRTDISNIIKELDLEQPKIKITESCKSISKIFNRIMNLVIEFYRITEFNHKDLAIEIKEKIYGKDLNISTHVDEALSRAYQDLVICEHKVSEKNYKFITLKKPRYSHAKTVMETTIPYWNGDWMFLSKEDLPVNTKEAIKFLTDKEKPFIAKVKINSFSFPKNLNVNLNKLLNLGVALGDGGREKPRNWVCQPEMLYLEKFSDFEIEAVFMANGYQEIKKEAELPYLGELTDYSYSMGIIAECVWSGLAMRSINPKTKSKSLVSPRACWLKAADRFMTLTAAMLMSSAGFEVVSYGYGAVTIMVEENKIKDLIELAPHAGLVVPMNMIEKIEYRTK